MIKLHTTGGVERKSHLGFDFTRHAEDLSEASQGLGINAKDNAILRSAQNDGKIGSKGFNSLSIGRGQGRGLINKSAFTLSEVLITLVIIGIIAALTVTSVIQNTQKNEIKVKVKKTYSTIQQAVSMEYAQTGRLIGNQGLDSFDNIKNNFLKKRLKLNVLQVPVWEGSEKYYLPDGTLIQIITFGTENNYALLDFRLNKGPDKTIEDINELGNNFQLTIIGNKVYPGHAYVSNGKVSGEDGELIEKGEVYYPQEREDWVQQAETLQKILTEK